MSLYDLKTEAQALPESWHSRILGRVGATNLKVLRMDAHSVAEEVHEYDEGLLVIDGRLELSVQEEKNLRRARRALYSQSGHSSYGGRRQLWHPGDYRFTRQRLQRRIPC
ncbi:Uncharacterised protein [Klebsiella grimontii]|uniref:Uncharacterized protein n=1 Tax=Klebsiella grimontii TaxID=2058152 RepID=A0A7H4P4K8_9ENTR|nr:Uncharacterised protein [Klebsiella grimontii]